MTFMDYRRKRDRMENEAAPVRKKETAGEFLRTFAYAVLIALFFRSVAYEPFHIPSGSMLSTLYEGDYIFVSKLSYGYSRYSFPFGSTGLYDGFKGRIFESTPKRGDVIVFRLPSNPRIDYIKRLIGLPGDRLRVVNGILYVNGEQATQHRIDDFQATTADGAVKFVPRFLEKLPGGPEHVILDENPNGEVDTTDEYVVPEGHYFFMGDNRDNSIDSRYLSDVGYVPAENLVGRATIIAFSSDPAIPLARIGEWLSHVRTERLFTRIK